MNTIRKSFDWLLCFLLKLLNKHILFPARWNMLTDILSPYIESDIQVLDVGSSDGRLASMLQKSVRSEFIGVDVLVQPETYIPIEKYDGKRLPFPDDSFDLVTLIDVIHHADDQRLLLEEAKRVTRKWILIKDHYWNSWPDFLVLKVADYMGNKPYGVSLPYKYWKVSDWHKMFFRLGLTIMKEKKFRFVKIDPVKQIIFLLQKNYDPHERNKK